MIAHEIFLAALVGAMQQAIQHWFPWRLLFKVELPRVAAYTIGTLGYLVPVSVLYWHWELAGMSVPYAHLAALWSCVIGSGVAVVITRIVDWLLDTLTKLREARQREELAMSMLRDHDAQG